MRNALISLFLTLISFSGQASRKEILLNENWMFRFWHQVQHKSEERVNLPHTWNATDALSGKQDYFRGLGNYTKKLFIKSEWEGKRLYLRFDGAHTVTNLFVNQTHVGEHRGGYGAFVFDITDFVTFGKDNDILVKVNNAPQLDIMPLIGDFNMYGGIYRDLNLVITDPVHIAVNDYASSGLYLIQQKVTKEQAQIQAKTLISNTSKNAETVVVKLRISDGEKIIQTHTREIRLASEATQPVVMNITIDQPHLWNGRKDPFMYQVEAEVIKDNKSCDAISQPMGLRFYHVDPDKGFFLNGEHLQLRGVCRHQDRAERGSALYNMHHEEDAAIMVEMGTNAIRLAHYPQSPYFYDLMDKYGIIVWAEIPFIGPGGYQDRGFIDQISFKDNGKEQLKELIRQHYNHPSICFWGLFNELKTIGDNPIEYITELNALAHSEDPTRPTTAASFLHYDSDISKITDVIAWNQYFGWYGGSPADMGKWLDAAHKAHPEYKIAISEYGAGASIYHQQDSIKPGIAAGWWHPENYQTYYHMGNWKALNERPFVWGSFIWNLFDFGAAHREEGDRPGINDKGLVTFDRKVKKDAFYFYKANWNKDEPFVYIANRRHDNRATTITDVMIFSNLPEVELIVNDKSAGKVKADEYQTFNWQGIELREGKNQLEAHAIGKKKTATDQVFWRCK